jgi:nucleotide-binding universal stress UspA family protein
MARIEGSVVVGVGGSVRTAASDNAAVSFGVSESLRRHVGLRLVGRDDGPTPWLSGAATPDAAAGEFAREMLDHVVERTRLAHPGLMVSGDVYLGSAANGLVAASAGAGVVIVAADARVHYGGLLAGLVSVQVAAHARTSVIVTATMDTPRPGPGRVVVGVDGSAASVDALGFAFDEARARGAELHAIYVWEAPDRPGLQLLASNGNDPGNDPVAADQMLREATERWADKYPEVALFRAAIRSDNPVRGLDGAAGGADLIVVGARGGGGFGGLLLGSVSDGLVRYSSRHVAVVRSPQPVPETDPSMTTLDADRASIRHTLVMASRSSGRSG